MWYDRFGTRSIRPKPPLLRNNAATGGRVSEGEGIAMKLNLSKEWYRQRAELDDKAEVSAGTLDINRLAAERPGTVVPIQSNTEGESPSPAFGRLINLWRRKRGLRIDALADRARIDVAELIEIEHNLNFVPEPRTVYQ